MNANIFSFLTIFNFFCKINEFVRKVNISIINVPLFYEIGHLVFLFP